MEELLHQAEQSEKEYEWLKAAELYEKALKLLPEDDFSGKAKTQERLGYAFYRAAFQAENNKEFRQRLNQVIAVYEKTKEYYQKLNDNAEAGRTLRCNALKALIDYWLATEASEKKKLLNYCWKLTKAALEAFESANAPLDYGKTYNMLSISPIFEFTLESDFKARVRIMKEAVECGDKAIKFFLTVDDIPELARAYAKTVVCLGVLAYYCQDGRDREESYQKGQEYWKKAKELSEEISSLESLYPLFGCQPFFGLEGTEEALSSLERGLEYARKTKDSFYIACALDWLTYHSVWRAEGMEDRDKKAQLAKTALQYDVEARDQFSKILFMSPRADMAWIEAYPADSDVWLAGMETDVNKKREMLEKALKAAPDVLKRANDSGYPEAISYAHSVFATILSSLAKMETNRLEKKKLLEQALQHMKESAARTELLTPLLLWNRGIMQASVANAKSDLAEVAEDDGTKKNLLREAAIAREGSLKLITEELTFMVSKKPGLTSLFATLGGSQSSYAGVLYQLYCLTREQEYLKKAMAAAAEAIESYQKLNLKSRIAELYWKIAQAYDTLGAHSDAAQCFDSASNNYEGAAEGIPQLKSFYQDHSCYMRAWNEIEKARHHHERQEYGQAEEHFQNAANMHKSIRQWAYLAPNYFAWAQVEHAEELSRKDQCEEALQTFEQATKLFEETKKSIQEGLAEIEEVEEKQMAKQIQDATGPRSEYCKARMAIEEAKILDKKGDHYASSEKYRSATATLQNIARSVESEQERKEFSLIATLSQAWAKMTQAEAQESSNLYIEAAHLFEQARELSPNEKTRMLASGHSRFCRALEAGTRFADTKDQALHEAFMENLENASNYYVRAGFRNASEYAKATRLLFDAYVQMANAQRENDPEKKAKLYKMADKILQTSAGSFMKAEHPEKREQVLKLLEKVKEEQELALSLSEVLHAPSVVSTTTAFTTPTPNQENAVGLERFEHADIQANLLVRQKELKIGENLGIELELVNAGKGSALLTKVTEIVPNGFDVVEKSENCRAEDGFINLKGKRLDPLKTEEVKLVLKPTLQGTFSIKPTVLYLDENGKYKSHEPDPVTITVKQLGIKGWLKGEK